jgi:hypothetical protein
MRAELRILAALLLVSSVAVLQADAKTYTAERFDTSIKVLQGGALEVTERVTFRFEDGTFERVFREIPTRRTDGIEIVSASMDDRPFPFGSGAQHIQVTRGSRVRVTWRFDPISDSTHTFVLTYLARGVVQQAENVDLLEWRALPSEHAYRIDAASVEFQFPDSPDPKVREALAAARVTSQRVDDGPYVESPRAAADESVARASARQIRRNGWIQVGFRLPKQSLITAPPGWQQQRIAAAAMAPSWLTGAALVAAAGLILLFALRQHYDPPPRDTAHEPSATSPDSLPPAVAGALVSNGRSTLEHAMATLFALADRGEITIDERPRGMFGQRNFAVTRRSGRRPLDNHERIVLDVVFGEGGDREVPLGTVKSRLVKKFKTFSRSVTESLRTAGLLDQDRARVRRRIGIFGGALMVASILPMIGTAVLFRTYGPWPLAVAGALLLVGLCGIIMHSAMTPLSDEGVRRGARWRAYQRHLKNVASDRERLTVDGPARVLPFAVALGLAAAWAKYLKLRPAEVPPWFHAVSAAHCDGFAAFVAHSGATSGHGSVGGAGAAGGGASGAS